LGLNPDTTWSKDDNRQEWFDESEHLIVAGILQTALNSIRILSRDYLDDVSK